jgi:signal recognition particle receptor subunit beta
MIFGRSERGKPPVEPVTLKILVAGGFGVGKTTLVGAVSEIRPLRTEELLTEAGRPVDDTSGVEGKHTTTVAMDFGRITLREDLVLYLFGTPGQERFWFMWDELSEGSLGAVVLADTRRLEDCFAALDYFERRSIPFVVGVNCFEGATVTRSRPYARPSTSTRTSRSCCATRATGRRSRRSSSRSSSTRWPTARSAARASPAEARARPVPPPTGVRAAARGTTRTRVCLVEQHTRACA